MTTPAMSYYEDKIRADKRLRREYRRHRWRWLYSPTQITAFTWEHSDEIFEYRKGHFTVKMAPVHPDWQVPKEYNTPIRFSLSAEQDTKIREALCTIPFSQLHTDPCSLVNLMEDGVVSDDLLCSLRNGFTFRFASQLTQEALSPLLDALHQICETSNAYSRLLSMRKWLFSDARWNQLHS